ncbi:hypothetical protein BLOT_015496 [Blomia tropicalis]|nr:hypothetical protein BLOT_015496 [Blomia tropicalis]
MEAFYNGPTANGMAPQLNHMPQHGMTAPEFIRPPIPAIPMGLHSLYEHCARVYPNQTNPLQVTAVLKYWLGGPDPLDYISMYLNDGDEENNIPPHWHYVSFGLSDLHGDNRVHPATDTSTPSGFGFELSFRLKKEDDEQSPPTWPASVMQALAKYVFQTSNILCTGDHVSWHCPLDNSESRIQHMLMTEDPQLGTALTPFGSVTFVQIVGVCLEELQAAQQWNGTGVIDLLKTVSAAGGKWLLTDMRRGETIFEIDPNLKESVDEGIELEGSNLSGVSAKCSYSKIDVDVNDSENKQDDPSHDRQLIDKDFKEKIEPNSDRNVESRTSRHSSMSVSHDRNSRMSFASETGIEPMELISTKFLDSLHLNFNYETGNLLPLALRGRLKHGRHFTFKNIHGDLAITFVTTSISGSFVNEEDPYAIHGPWLQVLIPDEYIETMLNDLDQISDLNKDDLPKTFRWEDINLAITLQPEE